MQRCDAITTEFENVPAAALVTLGAHPPIAPGAEAVATCQHRAAEKALFRSVGVRFDWGALGAVPCVLEQRLALAFELSVIVARSAWGEVVALPVQRNLHRDGILALTQAPAPDLAPGVARDAVDATRAIAAAMDYVGVLCVEFFVLADGSLVANEIAPRPHNSGHYSIDACDCSQFELQVRALAGLPLVAPRQHSAAVMVNLLGDLWFDAEGRPRAPDWPAVLAIAGVHLHLYGKTTARRGRKMGHLTVTAAAAGDALALARDAAARLGLEPWQRALRPR